MRSWFRMLVALAAAVLLPVPAAAASQFVLQASAPRDAGRAAVMVDGRVVASLPQIGAYLVEARASSLPQLRAAPGVLAAETNAVNRLVGLPITDPLAPREWYLGRVQAGLAWGDSLGDPAVKIAVVDSGVDYSNPELAGKVTLGPDFAEGDDDPMDTLGHGTEVASVAAAAEDGSGMVGLCPRCSVIAIKVIKDGAKTATKFDTAQGVVWAVDHGATVINLSLGGPDDDPVEGDAVAYALSHGVAVVASAGNEGNADPQFPAAYPGVIAVASSTDQDQLALTSSFGPWVDLAAPGTDMLAASLHNTYGFVNGTSFAAPVVAGITGLLESRVAGITPGAVTSALVGGAVPLPSLPLPRANAGRAMRLALGEPLEPEPKVSLTFVSFTVDGKVAIAGRSVTATATVMSSATGELVPEGDVVCEAYAGSRRIRLAKADFALGQAVCRWTIQPTATGKRFRAIFEVVASGASAARKFSLPLQTHQR